MRRLDRVCRGGGCARASAGCMRGSVGGKEGGWEGGREDEGGCENDGQRGGLCSVGALAVPERLRELEEGGDCFGVAVADSEALVTVIVFLF
mgnify:FL=1